MMSALLGSIGLIYTPLSRVEEADATVVSLFHAVESDLCIDYHKRVFF